MSLSVTRDIADLVGERLVVGLSGTAPTDEDVRTLRDTRAAGVILYRRNFESPEGLLALLAVLEEKLGRRLLVTTDHEGGRVIMLGRGTTIFPDNLAVGRAGSVEDAARQGEIEARELARLGTDLNLGPCLDVIGETYSPNIGIRSYGEDPALVARLGAARIRASQAAGVSTCAKHFPGKGHSPLDAHLSLATLDTSETELRARHLPPFVAAIEAGADAIMTSHPVYSRIDPVPATFSRRIVTGLLRDELGFRGAVFSDDLEMGAIGETCTIGEAAVRAAGAGHDAILVCHSARAQREAAEALVRAYRSGELPLDGLETSVSRLSTLRTKYWNRSRRDPPRPEPGGAELAASIASRAVTVVRGPLPHLDGRVGVIFPRFSELAARITIEDEVLDGRAWVERAFAGSRATPETALVGLVEPSMPEIDGAAALAARGPTVLFLYDARLYPANRALLEAVQARARSLVVVLLRDPWDRDLLAPGVSAITSFGWRACQLVGIVRRLLA